LKEEVEALEKRRIEEVLRETHGNRKQAEKILGLSHQGMNNKLKRYGFDIRSFVAGHCRYCGTTLNPETKQ